MFEVITILLLLAALFSFINERFLGLEPTIGLMLLALIFVIVLSFIERAGFNIRETTWINALISIDFSEVLLQGLLCFLLFAAAVHVSLRALTQHKWDVIVLAVLGTLLSTLLIACMMYVVLPLIGLSLPFIWALIFGAIISPTDPIAVLAILQRIGLPENLEAVIDGESQFNDGIGVVLVVSLISIAYGNTDPQLLPMVQLFLEEVFGGIALGLFISLISHYLIQQSSQVITQILISLAAVSTAYATAEMMHISGPIASVILGLILGKYSIKHGIESKNCQQICLFWELINQILNAVLFILIGLEALTIPFSSGLDFLMISFAIIIVLIARFLSVFCSVLVMNTDKKYHLTSKLQLASLFTWTGLRGALAIALVLSLPESVYKTILLPMVYGVVIFSILVQGLTIKTFFNKQSLRKLVKVID